MAPNLGLNPSLLHDIDIHSDGLIRCAVLGCGMMGQEHISYIAGYNDLRIDYLCDPHKPSLEKSLKVLRQFDEDARRPLLLHSEDALLDFVQSIDLLVIAHPNYLHADSLIKWGMHDIFILVEKPVAVSRLQHEMLQDLSKKPDFVAKIWVAMEYRFIPAIAKLISMVDLIGDLKMVTIRENRYPFLRKIGQWNRDPAKTGDTLVEKCCHFFDLFRLITGQEVSMPGIRALAQRGLNYQDELNHNTHISPIIDAAYVVMPFQDKCEPKTKRGVMGCLELCMYAEGSRHQEEIIVTGTKGRLEAYLPENKVFSFQRPCSELWSNRSEPPPASAIRQQVFDCSDVKDIHGIEQDMPTHGGYHYSSTAVEWYHLISSIHHWKDTREWNPHVSLEDGLHAVDIGINATNAITNENTSMHQAPGVPSSQVYNKHLCTEPLTNEPP